MQCSNEKPLLSQIERVASDDEAIDVEGRLHATRPRSSSPSLSSSKDSGVHDV